MAWYHQATNQYLSQCRTIRTCRFWYAFLASLKYFRLQCCCLGDWWQNWHFTDTFVSNFVDFLLNFDTIWSICDLIDALNTQYFAVRNPSGSWRVARGTIIYETRLLIFHEIYFLHNIILSRSHGHALCKMTKSLGNWKISYQLTRFHEIWF